MKTRIVMALLVIMICGVAGAQEHKVAKAAKLQIIEVGDVTVEGYDGSEIIFSSRSNDREKDERAKGLRAVSSLGLEDNTGLGLSVLTKGDVIEVRQLKKMDGPDIKIKVPKGVVISYQHSSPHGSDFRLINLDNQVEVSTVHNEVQLDNVTGVVNVKTVHGDINASFTTVKNAIVLQSVHGHVDVSLPIPTKASLQLDTHWGELFLDPDLKIEMDKKGELVNYSDNFSGKMNGGGTEIELSSTHNNVYVRKKN